MKLSLFLITLFIAILGKAAQWQTMSTCNQGQAILQVDANERRNFQLVIKDANIITYFNGSGAFRSYGSNFGNGRELIVGGYVNHGIFNAGDFQEAVGYYNYADHFQLNRENNGLKIVLKSMNYWSVCDGDISPSTGTCSGETRDGVNVYEYANWYFDDCK